MGSLGLRPLGRRSHQLSAEDSIPEPTGDTESIFIIGKVVLEVVLLKALVVRWEPEM